MSSSASALDPSLTWYRVGNAGLPHEGDRLHVRVNERYLTIFRQRGRLSALDSICHHASGPLTAGPLQDVEDLGVTVVLCPWHKFMVSIDEGRKVYQGVDFVAGKPVPSGWKIGKVVQRAHKVVERVDGLYVALLVEDGEVCASDHDACSALCGKQFPLYAEVSLPVQR